jgi:Na+/H+-dicarboxylate symporter
LTNAFTTKVTPKQEKKEVDYGTNFRKYFTYNIFEALAKSTILKVLILPQQRISFD